jgi:large subunit ribosomal protein L25
MKIMGKTILLETVSRETGSKAAVRVRKQGLIPAIIYGHKQEPVAISLNAHDFIEEIHHGHRLLDVKVDGKKEKLLIKELQYGHLGRDIIHADLMRVDVKEMVKVTVPVELRGASTAKGTHEGGIIEEHASHLDIECRATDIPEKIIISVKDVGVGDSLHAGDVELPEGIKLVSSADLLLVTCHVVAAAKTSEELEEEEPTAPEVIGEEKEPEEPAELK